MPPRDLQPSLRTLNLCQYYNSSEESSKVEKAFILVGICFIIVLISMMGIECCKKRCKNASRTDPIKSFKIKSAEWKEERDINDSIQ